MTGGMDVIATRWAEVAANWIEAAGVTVVVVGAVLATVIFITSLVRTRSLSGPYHAYRASLGRAILLGLELLVAGDIIATITVEPTLASAGALGVIVLIRTFLSFSLETEIEGRPPWRRERAEPGR